MVILLKQPVLVTGLEDILRACGSTSLGVQSGFSFLLCLKTEGLATCWHGMHKCDTQLVEGYHGI